MNRGLVLAYGLFAYALFQLTFLYELGFIMGFPFFPTTVDTGWGDFGILGNVLLIVLFGVQHTLMAQPAFKAWFTKIVPEPIERSTYVIATCLAFFLIFALWSPVPGILWHIENPTLRILIYVLSALGWLTVLYSTFLINHFDLFGLRQTYLYYKGLPYTPLEFKTVSFYKHIRHPLMLGFLVAFWSIPTMSGGHLTFAVAMTAYIFIGICFEEKKLIGMHGQAYEDYRKITGRVIPRFGG